MRRSHPRLISIAVGLLSATLIALAPIPVGAPATAAAVLYEQEDNDGAQQANDLSLGATMVGSTSGDYSTDYDTYRFTITRAGLVRLKLTFPSGLSGGSAYRAYNYDLEKEGWDGPDYSPDYIAGGDKIYVPLTQPTDGFAGQSIFLGPGTYYLTLSANNTWPTWGKEYRLSITSTVMDAEVESNDWDESATPMQLNRALNGSLWGTQYDTDTYVANVPKAGTYVLQMMQSRASSSSQGYEVTVSTNTTYYWATSWESTDFSRYRWWAVALDLDAGNNYISVASANGTVSEKYGKQYTVKLGTNVCIALDKCNVYYANDFTTPYSMTARTLPAGDVVSGDWDGDGKATVAVRNGSTFTFYDTLETDTGKWTTSLPGMGTGSLLVGDFNGDGKDDIATHEGNRFRIRYHLTTSGGPEKTLYYGRPGDIAFVGDWDSNGSDTFGVRRANINFLTNRLAGGTAEIQQAYGKVTDRDVLVGDWNGDGKDTITIRRGNAYHVKNNFAAGPADIIFTYGRATDKVIVGDWDGNGTETLAVVRR